MLNNHAKCMPYLGLSKLFEPEVPWSDFSHQSSYTSISRLHPSIGRSLVVHWSYTGPLLNVYSDKYFSNKTCCTIKEPRWGERCCNDDLNCMKNLFSCVPQRSTCVPSCLVSGLSHLAPPTLDKYLQENFRPSSKPLLSAAQTIHSHKGLEKATATRKHRHPHINGNIITWAEIEDGWKPAPLSDPVRVCKIKNTIYGICYIQRGSGGGV